MLRILCFFILIAGSLPSWAQGYFMFEGPRYVRTPEVAPKPTARPRPPRARVTTRRQHRPSTVRQTSPRVRRVERRAAPRVRRVEERRTEASYCRNCSRGVRGTQPTRIRTGGQRNPVVRSRLQAAATHRSAPIWNTFESHFNACAPGCQPVGIGTYRKPVRGKRSCHYEGRAIDIAAISCNGRTHYAWNENKRGKTDPKFLSMVRCMQDRLPHPQTLWKNGNHKTTGHHDHLHISMGCYGGTFH